MTPHSPTISGYRITSQYGWRRHPITGKQSFHSGTDFAPPVPGQTGVPIYAVMNGVVRQAGKHSSMGNYIYLQHIGDSKTSVYMHMASLNVKTGQTVSKGQKIGVMGTTGSSTGIHLHLMISKSYPPHHNGSNLMNPLDYLKGDDRMIELLVVDGRRGNTTIRRWQQFCGTPVDSKISKNSPLIKKWQQFLNTYAGANLVVDGEEGVKTIKAGQRFFKTPVDGRISSVSPYVKELQRFLNNYGR